MKLGRFNQESFSDEDILNMSVVEVTSPVAFQDDAENTAAVGGIYDRRMGSIEKTEPCETCDKVRLEIDASNSSSRPFWAYIVRSPHPKNPLHGSGKAYWKSKDILCYLR